MFCLSIYNKKNAFDFASVAKQFAPFAIGIIVLIGLFLLFQVFSELIKPQAIAAEFSDNPLDLAKNSFTMLTVTVTNITKSNAQPVPFDVIAEDPASIKITCEKKDLGFIEKGNERITSCLVRPTTELAGTYSLNIFVIMNSERFQKKMVLEVKTK